MSVSKGPPPDSSGQGQNDKGPDEEGPGIAVFSRFSIFYVIALSFLTQGLYLVYWHWQRTRLLNRALPSNPISAFFVNNTIAAFVVFVGLVLYTNFYYPIDTAAYEQAAQTGDVSQLDVPGVWLATVMFLYIVLILLVVWSFKIRNRLNQLIGPDSQDPPWFSVLMTGLFQAFYLQWQINRALSRDTNELTRRF